MPTTPPPSPSSISHSSATPPNTSPRDDPRLLIVIAVLGVLGACLAGFVIYITLRLKKRKRPNESSGPYEGAVVQDGHLAAQITPFGAGSPHPGRMMPQFNHVPGEDMRIALRQPDGVWHFADTRESFTPAGVKDIVPLPTSSELRKSMLSANTAVTKIPSNKEWEAKAARQLYKGYEPEYGFPTGLTIPPPAYQRESCNPSEHTDGDRPPTS